MRHAASLVLAAAAACCAQSALADASRCARYLESATLKQVGDDSAQLSADFKTAFNAMTLDKATATVSTVGATMVGSAMANEVAAAAQGLQHLVQARDRLDQPTGREVVIDELTSAMQDGSTRMRRVSMSYGQIARMAFAKDVQDLAAKGMTFADGLSRQWDCQP